MSATAFLVVQRLRRRWPATVALTVAVALLGGAAMAAVAGSRRSHSSMDRFVASSRPADILVAAQPGGGAALGRLGSIDGVARSAPGTLYALFPAQDLGEVFFPMVASLDGAIHTEINVPRVLSGRLADPDQPHEVALGERSARRLGLEVGDGLAMVSMSPSDLAAAEGDFPEPTGPSVTLDVVGIVRDPADVAANETDLAITILTPAFAEQHQDEIGVMAEMALVALRSGDELGSFTAAVRALDPNLEIEKMGGGAGGPLRSTLDVIASSLLLLAAVIAAVGGVVLAQVFHRRALTQRGERELLAALGASRRDVLVGAAAPGLIAAAVGAMGAVVVAVGASPLFPIGIARTAEPDPGVDVDRFVLLVGTAILVVVVTALQVGAELVARRTITRRQRSTGLMAPLAASASPVVTAGLLLPRGGGGGSQRSARGALALGLAGVVAAVTFATSLDELLTTPRLYGIGWDAGVAPDETSGLSGQAAIDDDQIAAIAADPAISEAQRGIFQVEVDIEGVPTQVTAVGDGTGLISTVVTRGRVPTADDEVAVARDTLAALDKDVGDTVGIDGGHGAVSYRIVGVAVSPVSSDGGSLTEGVSMIAAGVERLGAVDQIEGCTTDSCYQQVLVRFEDGADTQATLQRVAGEGTKEWIGGAAPAAVQRLSEVEEIPWVLAGLLSAVGAMAITHALLVVTRRRGREIGVLRSLGFTRGQVRSAIAVQATALAVWGVVVGLVAGVAVGRTVWRAVADSAGVVTRAVVPLPTVALAVVAIAVITYVAAAIPTIVAGRMRPADILRAE